MAERRELSLFWLAAGAAFAFSAGLLGFVIAVASRELTFVSIVSPIVGLIALGVARGRFKLRRKYLAVASSDKKERIRAELKRSALVAGVLLLVGVGASTYAWLDINGDRVRGDARIEAFDTGRSIGQTHCGPVDEDTKPEVLLEIEGADGPVLIVHVGGRGWGVPNDLIKNQRYIDVIELAGQPEGAQILLCFDAQPPESGESLVCQSGWNDTTTYELLANEVTISAHRLVGSGEGSASMIKQESCPTDDLPNWRPGTELWSELTEADWNDLADEAISSMS